VRCFSCWRWLLAAADVERHAVNEGVVVDGAGVSGPSADASRSASPVRDRSSGVIDENGRRSISSISIVHRPGSVDASGV